MVTSMKFVTSLITEPCTQSWSRLISLTLSQLPWRWTQRPFRSLKWCFIKDVLSKITYSHLVSYFDSQYWDTIRESFDDKILLQFIYQHCPLFSLTVWDNTPVNVLKLNASLSSVSLKDPSKTCRLRICSTNIKRVCEIYCVGTQCMSYIKYGILLYDFCNTRFVLCKTNKIVY
jgi:hypothetical protein